MGYSVDNIYTYMRFLVNKNQSGGVSDTDLFYSWNSQQRSYQADLLGRWQNRNNTKTGANIGLIEDARIMEILSEFTINDLFDVTNGLVVKPDNFIHLLSMRINDETVTPINTDQTSSVLKSVIDAPSEDTDTYYYTQNNLGFILYPQTLSGSGIVALDYIVKPTDIVWGYTWDTDNRQIYDPLTSVQPQWQDDVIVEITKRTLTELGVRFSSQDLQNFGKTAIATGD